MGGSTQRLAAIAAISHARHYNHTQPEITQTDAPSYSVNALFISATICGVLVAVCAACWRRAPSPDKPDEGLECRGVYTVSTDDRLNQVQDSLPGPPPAYDTVVDDPSIPKDDVLEEVVTVPDDCPRCHTISERCDSGLPSYEAAVLLKDTKL